MGILYQVAGWGIGYRLSGCKCLNNVDRRGNSSQVVIMSWLLVLGSWFLILDSGGNNIISTLIRQWAIVLRQEAITSSAHFQIIKFSNFQIIKNPAPECVPD